jgi:uncharacterized protein YkwD
MGAGHRAAVAAAYAMLFALSTSASAAPGCPEAQPIASGSSNAASVAATVCAINAERRAAGVAPLRWDGRLALAAERMATDMGARNYFAHVTPEGQDLVDRVVAAGYAPAASGWPVAEDIGWGSGDLAAPDAIVAGWLGSPAHRRNLLSPDYSRLGVGVVHGSPLPGGDAGVIFVADFGAAPEPRVARRARRRRPCWLGCGRYGLATRTNAGTRL